MWSAPADSDMELGIKGPPTEEQLEEAKEAARQDLAERVSPYDEHWRHQSVLWAQGLLERYGYVSLDTGSATRVDSGWMWETFTRAGIPTGFGVEETPRAAAERIVPQLGSHDPAQAGSQPCTYEPRTHQPNTGEPQHQSQPSTSPAPNSIESSISPSLSGREGKE